MISPTVVKSSHFEKLVETLKSMMLKKENVKTLLQYPASSVSQSNMALEIEEQGTRTEIIRTGWDKTHSSSGLP